MPDLTDRQRRILTRLIVEYVEQGEPVSSARLAGRGLKVSSATIRNVLARLEERGLVRQPHTSAGRVPTDSGYRLYVDGLLDARRRPRQNAGDLRLARQGTVEELLTQASLELSRVAHQVGFAFAPAGPSVCLRHIDFAGIDANRVLVIVVTTGGHVTHRVIELDEPCEASALARAAGYVNAEFAGLTLHDARAAIVERLGQERALYDALVGRALRLAQAGLRETAPEEHLHIQGTSYLIDDLLDDSADHARTLEALRVLFRMIEEKHRLVSLLTRYIEAGGVTVIIGSEHATPDLQSFSLVASSFGDGERAGTVGVIGPTRMRYERAISVVDRISQALTKALDRS